MRPAASFKLRLYIAGGTVNSATARTNLTALCRRLLPGRHEIEIVDVHRDPNRALTDGIFMTPSLLKISPSPVRMIVGTLSNPELLLEALGLSEPVPA